MKIKIASPEIPEEVRQKHLAELEQKRAREKEKDARRWKAYTKHVSKMAKRKKLIVNGLNTTK